MNRYYMIGTEVHYMFKRNFKKIITLDGYQSERFIWIRHMFPFFHVLDRSIRELFLCSLQ